ncbi:hypothetical protein HMPREF0063_11570 [Aeromicrobium marinum DSM 15272]|uniref:Peptidase M15C domain-containing protein n=1 Tax=Aeromicrobium marinum DSM 15272 TaxID=585531 RepID=E2SC11_9ACTN|nr:M15 family metallopeptidase [Aeromicrobium marinum]EFQ83297.1 hypothetical protein HMPREF0063_11570 [Aeromicrobium marinum DSM 15272]
MSTPRWSLLVPLAALVLVTACSGGPDPAPASPQPPPTTTVAPAPAPAPTTPVTPTTADPVVSEIPDEQWDRIVATGAWREGCPVGRDDLRVLTVHHVDLAGEVQRGTLVAHRDVMASLSRIFTSLFDAGFPIERMEPVETYGGDTLASLQANNTSAYNCRRPDQINAPVLESPHANGRAIDINPDLNPWMDLRCRCWSPRDTHAERTPGPGKILPGGPEVALFEDEGWIWQNIDVPDYMHFDTGYPSAPWTSPNG